MKRILALITLVLLLATPAVAAKKYDDSVLDGSLNVVKNGATTLVLCSGEPADYAGVAAVTLGTKAGLTSGSYTGPADHTSGRKLTVNAQTGITPGANGTVTHACLTNGSSILYGCTTTTSQAVTTSQTWDTPAFIFIYVADPT